MANKPEIVDISCGAEGSACNREIGYLFFAALGHAEVNGVVPFEMELVAVVVFAENSVVLTSDAVDTHSSLRNKNGIGFDVGIDVFDLVCKAQG